MIEISTEEIFLKTKGFTDIQDITPRVADMLEKSGQALKRSIKD